MLLIAALISAGCVPYPGLAPEQDTRRTYEGPFAPLDAGASELSSLHFLVRAYGEQGAQDVAEIAEKAYSRIMTDTNLYSFKPKGLYHLVIYTDAEEFRKKTGMPVWSSGVTVNNAIYSFEGRHLAGILAHEMTHLIFHEYMGRGNQDHRWINEGLAVYEESSSRGAGRGDIFAAVAGNMRREPLPMDQLMRLVPATEREYKVSLWYAQAESMIRHMIDRGGRIGFSQFLQALHGGASLDQAVNAGFPGVWMDLAEFERDWTRSRM